MQIEYMYARDEEVYYQIRSTFFESMFLDSQITHVEEDHMLVWLPASEAIRHLHRRSQAWAIQPLLRRTDGFSGTFRESGL